VHKKYYFLIIALCFLILVLRYSDRSRPRQGSDFRVTYETAKRFMAKEDIYTKFDDPTVANFKYSPLFALIVAPLSFLSLHQAGIVFFIINFIFLLMTFIFSEILIVDDPLPKKDKLLLILLSLAFTFRYILGVLDSGQINIMMIAFVVIALYLVQKKKEGPAGAFIALAVMFKYTPFVFIPYFAIRGKWKVVVYTFAFIALYCIIPAVYLGISKNVNYLHEWMPFLVRTSLDQGSLCDLKNQSFYSLVLRYFTTGQYFCDKIRLTHLTYHQGLILSAVLSVFIYSLVLLPVSNSDSKEKVLIDYALLFICKALFNANAWTFNYAALIFPYMLLFYYLFRTQSKDKTILVLIVAAFILGTIGTRGLLGAGWREWTQTLAFTTIGALLVMIALFKLKFGRASSKQISC